MRLAFASFLCFVVAGCPSTQGNSDAGECQLCQQCPLPDASACAPNTPDAGGDAGLPMWPQVPANLGRVMSSMTLVTMFAGNDDAIAPLEAFSDNLRNNAWFQTVGAEYGVGQIAQSVHYVGPSITAPMSEAQIRNYIVQAIDGGAVPAPNGNTFYLLYLPTMDAGAYSDSTACGYHSAFPFYATTAGDGFGTVRRCTGNGATAMSDLQVTASHELMETATDPTIRSYSLGAQPKVPWTSRVWNSYVGGTTEVGDLCEGTLFLDDAGFFYQRIWSNNAAADGGDPCLPATDNPYFNVSVAQDWYEGTAGTTVSIPLTGWGSGNVTGSWVLNPHLTSALGSFQRAFNANAFAMQISSPTGLGTCTAAGTTYSRAQIDLGGTATLEVAVPSDAQPGDYAVLSVHSFLMNANGCAAYAGTDYDHQMVVGVYVP